VEAVVSEEGQEGEASTGEVVEEGGAVQVDKEKESEKVVEGVEDAKEEVKGYVGLDGDGVLMRFAIEHLSHVRRS
jgi:hypothetical protein